MENPIDNNSATSSSWYARIRPLHSLQHRSWRILWFAGNLWQLAFWMDLLVLGWLVLELTDSPFQVSMVAACRMFPLVLGLYFGSLGDRFSKRNLLVVVQLLNAFASIALMTLLLAGVAQLWHIYVVALLTGVGFAADFPIRQAFIRDLVPEGSLVNAMSLDTASWAAVSMIGRFLGGGLLALVGAGGAYAFLSGCYVLGLLFLARVPSIKPASDSNKNRESIIGGLAAGLRYSLGSPIVRGVIIVTVLVNALVFSYTSLTPVFAKDVLGVGPGLLGVMSGMEGVGFLVGAMIMASVGSRVGRLGLIFLLGALTISIGTFLFSISTVYIVSVAMLFLVGLGMGGFITTQHVLSISKVHPEMRARVMGVLAMFLVSMPLGFAYVGFLADSMGAPRAVGVNTFAAILILIVLIALQSKLRRFSM